MQNGESDVLNQFHQGNADAFETLFHQHQRAVYCWILRITRNPAASEDVTIETFWRIYSAHARFEPERGFEAGLVASLPARRSIGCAQDGRRASFQQRCLPKWRRLLRPTRP